MPDTEEKEPSPDDARPARCFFPPYIYISHTHTSIPFANDISRRPYKLKLRSIRCRAAAATGHGSLLR